MVTSGDPQTLVLSNIGIAWNYSSGNFGQLGYGGKTDHLVLILVGAEGQMKVVSLFHSVVLGAFD